MPDTAVIEAPQQVDQKPSSMRDAFAAAHAKSIEAGGIEGQVSPEQRMAAAQKIADQKAADQQKLEQSKQTQPPKPDEKKGEPTKSPFDGLDQVVGKKEDGSPEVDPSKLSKEEKAEGSYRKLRQERDAFEAELKSIKEKIGDSDVASLKKEYDEIKKQHEETSRRLAARDVTESKQFQEHVTKPSEAIVKRLEDSAKKYGFSERELNNILFEPDGDARGEQLDKLFSASEKEMPNVIKLGLYSSINELLQRQEYGQRLVREAKTASEALKAEDARKAQESKENSKSEYSRISDLVFKHLTREEALKVMPFLGKEKDGSWSLDDERAKSIRSSMGYEESTEPQIKAMRAFSAEVLPLALEHNKTLSAKVAELEDRIAKLSGSSPKIDGGNESQSDAPSNDGKSLAERMRALRGR